MNFFRKLKTLGPLGWLLGAAGAGGAAGALVTAGLVIGSIIVGSALITATGGSLLVAGVVLAVAGIATPIAINSAWERKRAINSSNYENEKTSLKETIRGTELRHPYWSHASAAVAASAGSIKQNYSVITAPIQQHIYQDYFVEQTGCGIGRNADRVKAVKRLEILNYELFNTARYATETDQIKLLIIHGCLQAEIDAADQQHTQQKKTGWRKIFSFFNTKSNFVAAATNAQNEVARLYTQETRSNLKPDRGKREYMEFKKQLTSEQDPLISNLYI